ncbi:hydroxyacylglutathione hydrolase [Carnobacterium viridans]|uniref:Hydroxyacylglutathione hydrolase n=1 Tax=Carnobacterium viridans TaxID=174587 RepID=A0A1H1A5V9_9LACT|nr:hydroxyacylglutathione hydrolase [Carnobacterium viridans]UDE94289.1 hydroxyacylglutathione hydrolase [Carnobacterium viridans]SDQ35095.1 hydroxyacylglutathione hydrolase [Carnobacterium viridans]
MDINLVKAFSDNYIWIIEEGTEAVVVDPGEAEQVMDYLAEKQLQLNSILLTHNHDDHIGGVQQISAKYPDASIYGPKETEDIADHIVVDGDSFSLLGQNFQVLKTGGHTEGHISFLMDNVLFCGDALFSAGCGRVFTKDYQAQYDALQKFKQLDDEVQVYAAHEYTQTNLRFAHSMQPSNTAISEALNQVNEMRAKGKPTLPTTIGKEKKINLFLQAEKMEDFKELRDARDKF